MRSIFDKYVAEIKREGIEELVADLDDLGYFTAPASSNFHLATEGGLLEHSLNVTRLMVWDAKTKNSKETLESIYIVGLFHDLGKANFYNKPLYIENILKSGKRSEAKPYERNKELVGLEHELASIVILLKYIELTEDEIFAIRWSHGLYTSGGYDYKGKETELSLLINSADMWASRIVEGKGF